MAALHGGARVGSGPKPKGSAPATDGMQFDDPLAYLIAVSTGATPGDALRVAAAKAALPYTLPRTRAPVASPPPRVLATRQAKSDATADLGEWQAKADAIRARHKRGTK